MGSEFTFYDYIDDEGRNVVYDWLHTLPKPARVKFTKWLQHLEATPRGQWSRPQVDTLDGHCAGLFEIRVAVSRLQYRILGSDTDREDNEPTLLHCFVKTGKKVPHKDCDHALLRKAEVEANPHKRRVEHNYE